MPKAKATSSEPQVETPVLTTPSSQDPHELIAWANQLMTARKAVQADSLTKFKMHLKPERISKDFLLLARKFYADAHTILVERGEIKEPPSASPSKP